MTSPAVIKIDALPAFTDNYIWLLQDPGSQRCAVVDPGDDAPVRRWLAAHPQWQLSDILITHHHYDHVNGVESLKQAFGARVHGPAGDKIAPMIDQTLHDGDILDVLGMQLRVIAVPGHTLDHIAYYHAPTPLLLCGDTLFAAGCGRLFEGTPAQMHASLQRLAALPERTQIYCTHEYTLANLRFAAAVEPGNRLVGNRLRQVQTLREQAGCSLPSNLALELATNPFLRCAQAEVVASVRRPEDPQTLGTEEVFTRLRRWKDEF